MVEVRSLLPQLHIKETMPMLHVGHPRLHDAFSPGWYRYASQGVIATFWVWRRHLVAFLRKNFVTPRVLRVLESFSPSKDDYYHRQ